MSREDRGGAVVVVEYLQSIMCEQLVGKFPDNSAFDFDYTQSSIWSPLIQRRQGQDLDIQVLSKSLSPTVLERKLKYDEDDCDEMWENETSGKCVTTSVSINKLTASFNKKIGINVFDSFKIYTKLKKTIRKKGFGFSAAAAASSPKPRKGWAKMLKAASGNFKRTSNKKEKCNATQLKFSPNYLGYLND